MLTSTSKDTYQRPEGVSLTVTVLGLAPSGSCLDHRISNGSAHFAKYTFNAANGEVAVLVNDNSEGNDKIIVDNSIQNIWTLKGKKIALEAGVVDDFLMTLALQSVGLNRNDVQVVNMDTESAAKAFLNGQVDGVGAFPPFWDTALKLFIL